ncbi:MAG: TatD family hydrolase [Candidatus Nanopelagicales bacterium]|nr:TatD family hydrolase [Candidatus Nanopelagicales bacterium]
MSAEDLPVPPPEALPRPVIDSHCHLDLTEEMSGLTPGSALAAAAAVGVSGVIQVGVDLASSRRSVELAHEFESVFATVALHPNDAPERMAAGGFESDFAQLAELAADPRVRAVGETGLDWYRTGDDGRAGQEAAFREHVRLARALGKTLVVHDRDAHEAVLAVLESEDLPDAVVLHCFSGDAALARRCADAGWYISFAGVVTFKNAAGLREALVATPPSLMLAETDAPFLTPMPNRGKPNASYLMPSTVREMARVTGVELGELCDTLRANTVRAFGLPGESS